MESSVKLLEFYKWWLEGGNERTASCGLCANIFLFSNLFPGETWQEYDLLCELKQQFAKKGLDTTFPFNTGLYNYCRECDDKACHDNKERLRWVLDRIADMEL